MTTISEHCEMINRTLPDDPEVPIVPFIQSNFGALGRGLDQPTLKPVVLMLIQSLVIENFLPPTILNFKCFNHLLNAFRRRHGLSFRRTRAARRPEIDDEECAIFMIALKKVVQDFPEVNIVNFDEWNRCRVMASEEIVGECAAEVVHNCTDGNAKGNFSFVASICANGTKLPLVLIARGKTMQCHQHFGDQVPESYQIWQSQRGWSTEDLMFDYLAFH
jgi:hypothetical protein